jgi:hypothetical protein
MPLQDLGSGFSFSRFGRAVVHQVHQATTPLAARPALCYLRHGLAVCSLTFDQGLDRLWHPGDTFGHHETPSP